MGISRRAVLGGIGQSATLGALASALSLRLQTAQAAAPAAPAASPAAPAAAAKSYCLSMIYGKGGTFNADLFKETHLPLLQGAYEKSASRIELRMPEKAEGSSAPEIIAAVNIWISDVPDFSQRNKKAAQTIADNMAFIAKGPVSGQVDEVLMSQGDDRLAVPVDSLCLSTYFPAKEGATIDSTHFVEVFYPKLAELYGTTVVRRVEVTGGAAGAAGGKPKMLNSAHLYIRDDAAFFEKAATDAGKEMAEEAPNHTNIKPMYTFMRVFAAG